MAKFKPGDTITSGDVYWTIERVTKTHYQITTGTYMPIKLVDTYWELVSNEGEIVDD